MSLRECTVNKCCTSFAMGVLLSNRTPGKGEGTQQNTLVTGGVGNTEYAGFAGGIFAQNFLVIGRKNVYMVAVFESLIDDTLADITLIIPVNM